MAPEDTIIINQSGRGDKDIFTIADAFEDPAWQEFIVHMAQRYTDA
jgi:tryptophan synthase beta chain